MRNLQNIFDLSNVSDIPHEIKEQLGFLNKNNFEEQLVELFTTANMELNLDQIMVGFYRKYGETKERRAIINKLYNMCRYDHPLIKKVEGKKGVYKLRKNNNDEQE